MAKRLSPNVTEEGRRGRGKQTTTDLLAALVESLDGEDDAAAGGGSEEGAVDGAEATLAELERAAEPVGGAAELVQVEHPQPLRAPLLRQLLYAPGRCGRRRRRLALILSAGVRRRRRLGGRGDRLLFLGPVLAALEGEAPHLIRTTNYKIEPLVKAEHGNLCHQERGWRRENRSLYQ
jgi:hypothetical protein